MSLAARSRFDRGLGRVDDSARIEARLVAAVPDPADRAALHAGALDGPLTLDELVAMDDAR